MTRGALGEATACGCYMRGARGCDSNSATAQGRHATAARGAVAELQAAVEE